jgi:hypothetical protein
LNGSTSIRDDNSGARNTPAGSSLRESLQGDSYDSRSKPPPNNRFLLPPQKKILIANGGIRLDIASAEIARAAIAMSTQSERDRVRGRTNCPYFIEASCSPPIRMRNDALRCFIVGAFEAHAARFAKFAAHNDAREYTFR